ESSGLQSGGSTMVNALSTLSTPAPAPVNTAAGSAVVQALQSFDANGKDLTRRTIQPVAGTPQLEALKPAATPSGPLSLGNS
ncbi:MAG: hypothetical protein CFE44_26355, partial [Burkholderiales bacterium PBB4]